tara:strand:+ start:82 stop:699 length:618 start_codon:yes stop_codon:yes gene_type:complete
LPLLGCKKYDESTKQIDTNSYINDFELVQENSNNQTRVKITSPKAIINSINNDIEIFDSSIEIINKKGRDIIVKSGKSSLNNFSNIIKVFKNVNISFFNNQNLYITTNSFDWDLNTSVIDINNPLFINFQDSNIKASNGFYNINSSLLEIDNAEFNRYIYNLEGIPEYQIEIKSDFAKLLKNDKTLVFTSNEKQVETTINLLLTK